MPHMRKSVRQLVRDRLIAAGLAGGRIFAARHRPVIATDLPCILVYSLLDEVGPYDMAVAPRERKLTLVVVPVVNAAASADSTADDDLDDLAAQVETVMEGDGVSTFGIYTDQVVHGVTFSRTELKKDEAGAMTVLSALMFYEIQYRGQV